MITDIFSPGGGLQKALETLGRPVRLRQAQKTYAERVEAVLDAHQPGFLDAETGVGKTLGYLVPTMLKAFEPGKGALVVVSTASIALQRQLIADDIPVAAQLVSQGTGFQPKVAMRIGREQVVDPVRLQTAIEELASPQEQDLADEVLDWVREQVLEGQLPLRADLMERFADQITNQKGWLVPSIIGRIDDEGDVGQLYEQLLEECRDADVLVVNHHLLAVNLLRSFLWDKERPVYLIVDEADRLPDIINTINRQLVPLHLLASNVASFPHSAETKAVIDDLSEIVMSHFDKGWKDTTGGVVPTSRLDAQEKADLQLKLKQAGVALDAFLARLHTEKRSRNAEVRERISEIDYQRFGLARLAEETQQFGGQAVLYYSPVRQFPGVGSVNTGSALMIASRLWSKSYFDMKGLIFTSATLASMSSSPAKQDAKLAMKQFITDCGFKFADVPQASCALIAPEQFGRMTFVRPSLAAPAPFVDSADEGEGFKLNPTAVAVWAEMVKSAAAEGGRTLCLLPSYRDVVALGAELEAMGDRVIVQSSGLPTNAAVVRFLANPDAIWISAAAWEGVSLPGAISHIVIPRLPMRPSIVDDGVIERYFAENGNAAKGASYIFGRKLASTRRRLRQGIGRGVRTADDSVKVWIGDNRWPLTQGEMDRDYLDQPTNWSSTLLNAVPERFRKTLEKSRRYV
jgi:Rad3-related DNA helicase